MPPGGRGGPGGVGHPGREGRPMHPTIPDVGESLASQMTPAAHRASSGGRASYRSLLLLVALASHRLPAYMTRLAPGKDGRFRSTPGIGQQQNAVPHEATRGQRREDWAHMRLAGGAARIPGFRNLIRRTAPVNQIGDFAIHIATGPHRTMVDRIREPCWITASGSVRGAP